MKVLVSAFTCGPSGGSEPGAGWAWTLAAARENDVWVLTRHIPADRLEQVIAEHGATGLRVVYVDTAPWIRRWFRGGLGLRISYLAWQRKAARVARRLDEEIGFDLVHHLTFANVWLPTGASAVDAPFVLGPVGGGPRVALRMWPELGARGAAMESLRISAQLVSRLNPSVRRGWRKARVILVQNRETLEALPRRYRHKCRIRQNAVMEQPAGTPGLAPRARSLVDGRSQGRDLRGPARGVERAQPGCSSHRRAQPDWNLVIVGSGPELPRLRRLVRDHRLEERVEFIPWLPRAELHRMLARADVVVVPSLRDDSPFIVAEAQALGRPVAAFDQGGLATFAALDGTAIELAPLDAGSPPGGSVPRRRHRAGCSHEGRALPETVSPSTGSSPICVESTPTRQSPDRADRVSRVAASVIERRKLTPAAATRGRHRLQELESFALLSADVDPVTDFFRSMRRPATEAEVAYVCHWNPSSRMASSGRSGAAARTWRRSAPGRGLLA